MESKHKNALIGALLAVVFVMAVGYAAFAQTLTITGSASIDSNWSVHYDTSRTTGTGIVDVTMGTGGSEYPTGSITFSDQYNAVLTATLNNPGDKVVFTLTIVNDGTINATLGTPVISTSDEGASVDNLVYTHGNITFTVTSPVSSSLTAGNNTTMTVTAEFNASATEVGDVTSASITVTTLASQAA